MGHIFTLALISITGIHRSLVLPRLLLRKARIEDFDDLLPLFTSHDILTEEDRSPQMLQALIQKQNDHNKVSAS